MEEFFISCLLLLTFVLTYRLAHNVLWFQVDQLFEIVPTSGGSAQDKQFFQELGDTHIEDKFLYRFYSSYSISWKYVQKAVRTLFCLILSLSVIVVEIVLWKIKTYDETNTSNFIISTIWPIDIFVLSLCLILIVPYLCVLMILNKFYADSLSTDSLLISTGGIVTCWLVILKFINIGPFFYTDSLLTKLALVGTTVMAALSGVASISTPYHFVLTLWSSRAHFRHRNINELSVTSFLSLNDSLLNVEKIKDYESNINENIQILKKLKSLPENGSDLILKQQLIEKISWYKLELDRLRMEQKRPQSIKLAMNLFYMSFSIFCIFKLIVVFGINIPNQIKYRLNFPTDIHFENFRKENEADPLAVTLANILDITLFTFDHQQDLDALSKQISLIFSLSMFVCSLSTVLSTISRLLSLLPIKVQIFALSVMALNEKKSQLPLSSKDNQSKKNRDPSIIKNLIFVELVGSYILATVLLIRSNLPFDVSEKLDAFLGGKFSVPSVNIDIWFDTVFAWTVVFTLLGVFVTTFGLIHVPTSPYKLQRH